MKRKMFPLLMELEKKKEYSTFNLKFAAWKRFPKVGDWEAWVSRLCRVHKSTWKSAGIFEAIRTSMYNIARDDKLLYELALRWRPGTNTFVFQWGEATITLDDMLVLGGYSAVGVPTLSPVDIDVELLDIKDRLEEARLKLQRSKTHNATVGKWMETFHGDGGDLEHAAFLAMWLSRFVFPTTSSHSDIINKHVFPIAARLSKGIKVALGPTILAMLYRDLTALANRLRLNDGESNFSAPFPLVQVWAWERFPTLHVRPNFRSYGENFPRLAKWWGVIIPFGIKLSSAFDFSEKGFVWCPYGPFGEGRDRDRDLKCYNECIKTMELVGFDGCIEEYQPLHVTKQFRFDQEKPISQNMDERLKELGIESNPELKRVLEIACEHIRELDASGRITLTKKQRNDLVGTLVMGDDGDGDGDE